MNIANVHKPGIPSMHGDQIVLVVLTSDDRGFFAAYQGIVPARLPDQEAIAFVSARGAKMMHHEAVLHFPGVPVKRYRA